ncbi:hypothetical protein [Deinococcus sp.]|uniref:hypothetical protein n=1 Tax=Deinococcus sp. TaxID=47478 RepID=UPI003B59A24F
MKRLAMLVLPLALGLSSLAAAQASAPSERFGVQLGGIPPILNSGGVYFRVATFGQNHLEVRGLANIVYVPNLFGAFGGELDLLVSHPLSNGWRVYGGPAVGIAKTSANGGQTYTGVGALVGIRGGKGFGLFLEGGAATFFGGSTAPLVRAGLQYSF